MVTFQGQFQLELQFTRVTELSYFYLFEREWSKFHNNVVFVKDATQVQVYKSSITKAFAGLQCKNI